MFIAAPTIVGAAVGLRVVALFLVLSGGIRGRNVARFFALPLFYFVSRLAPARRRASPLAASAEHAKKGRHEPSRVRRRILLSFGPYPVFTKLYPVASERAVSLSQVHADCGEKLVQQYVCAKDGSVVPKVSTAKQYRFDDGTVTTLTDEDIKSAGPEAEGQIELLECVPDNSLDPVCLGKTTFLGPDQDRGIDGYIALVDALTAARVTAVCRYSTRSRDQLVAIQRYGERGLLMHEVFYADELRPLEEIELPRSVPNPLMAEAFAGVIARAQKERFAHAAYKDGYPERLLRAATDRANAGIRRLRRDDGEPIEGGAEAGREGEFSPGGTESGAWPGVREEDADGDAARRSGGRGGGWVGVGRRGMRSGGAGRTKNLIRAARVSNLIVPFDSRRKESRCRGDCRGR